MVRTWHGIMQYMGRIYMYIVYVQTGFGQKPLLFLELSARKKEKKKEKKAVGKGCLVVADVFKMLEDGLKTGARFWRI